MSEDRIELRHEAFHEWDRQRAALADMTRQRDEAVKAFQRERAKVVRAREALDIIGVLHPVAADRVLRALDASSAPQTPSDASEAPGQGSGAENAGDGESGVTDARA